MSPIGRLLRSIVELPTAFQAILETDPLSIALFAVGSLLFAAVGLVAAYLVAGALLDWVTPSGSTPTWRPAR